MNAMTVKRTRLRSRKKRKVRIFKLCFKILLLMAVVIFIRQRFQTPVLTSSKKELIPESLLELAQNHPETKNFVYNYPEKKDLNNEIDISGQVKKGSIPLFLQWDEQWGYKTYGNDFMAVNGCGPVCLSMVVCGLTGDTTWNPYKVAQFSEENGYYVPGVGTSWDLMTLGAQALGLTVSEGQWDESWILNSLSESTPIICTMAPGDFTTTGHFIVLTGVDSKGKIIVNDPNSKANSKKHWDIDVLLPQIRNLWIYQV